MKPEWRTSTVTAIVAQMRQDNSYSTLPILADALQDAGCDDEELLAECRDSTELRSYNAYHKVMRIIAICESEEGEKAVAFIEQLAGKIDQTFNRLMRAAADWDEEGEYTYDNSESYKRSDVYAMWPRFWECYEIVTWKKVKYQKSTFFTCSC